MSEKRDPLNEHQYIFKSCLCLMRYFMMPIKVSQHLFPLFFFCRSKFECMLSRKKNPKIAFTIRVFLIVEISLEFHTISFRSTERTEEF